MTKAELVEKIHEAAGDVSLRAVEAVLKALADVGAAGLLGGGEIPLRGLGKLKTKATAERMGRNPRTKEAMCIPAGRRVVFIPSSELKQAFKA